MTENLKTPKADELHIPAQIKSAPMLGLKRKLNRLGIKLRGLRDSHMVSKNENFILDLEVLNGTLLGDGCLCKSSKTDQTAPRYSKYSSKEDYAIYIASLLSKNPKERLFPVTKETNDNSFEGYSFSDFLKLIGPCPIRSMEYKWKESNLTLDN